MKDEALAWTMIFAGALGDPGSNVSSATALADAAIEVWYDRWYEEPNQAGLRQGDKGYKSGPSPYDLSAVAKRLRKLKQAG